MINLMGLRRYNVEAPEHHVLEGIWKIHEHGFIDAGYRVIWRMLNVNLGLRAMQTTVRRLLKLLDPKEVVLKRGHRL